VEWPPAVFQIDAGDKCPRWRAPGEQISQAGSVAREVCASGPLVDAIAAAVVEIGVARAVAVGVAAVDAVVFAAAAIVAEAATVDEIAVVRAVAVGFVAAGNAVAFGSGKTAAVAVVVVEVAVAPVAVAAVAFVAVVAVLARPPAGKTSPAVGQHCYKTTPAEEPGSPWRRLAGALRLPEV